MPSDMKQESCPTVALGAAAAPCLSCLSGAGGCLTVEPVEAKAPVGPLADFLMQQAN